VVTAGPVSASSPITYSGRGIALSGTVAGNLVGFGDTLSLPSTGGHQDAGLISAGVSGVLGGDTLHAATTGLNDRTRSEASAAGVTINVGNDSITADFAMSRTMAVSGNGAPTLSGTSEVAGLVVNNTAVTVTGAANQIVTLPDGELVVNERTTSTSGDTGSITINALHLNIATDTDLMVGSSRAGVTSGSSNCSSGRQPTTGGGWIVAPSTGKGTFGVSGRATATGAFGHVVYTDHGTGTKIQGTVTAYSELGNGAFMQGPAQVNGQPSGNFQLTVQDNGEPGTTDTFSIQTDGVPAQSAAGTLQGGNIQYHRPCH
jgi:hypothetical protein